MIASYNQIISYFIAFMIFMISLYISPYYINGDQSLYRTVYNVLPTLNIYEGFIYYKNTLTAKEFVHFIITWIFSRIVEKDILMSFVNAIFAYYSMQLFIKWKASIYIAAIIVLTNYYFFVLYFAADRLKFGFLFFALALLNVGNSKFYVHSFLSLTSHAQLFIIYAAMIFNKSLIELKRVLSSGNIQKKFLISIICLFFVIILMFNQISHKFLLYFAMKDDFYISNLFKLSVFLILALIYSKRKTETISLFFPLFIVAFILGADRINLYGYFIFLYYALPINKGFNIGIIVTSVYFAYKSVFFVIKILETGNGF